jgi:hypothetical protein
MAQDFFEQMAFRILEHIVSVIVRWTGEYGCTRTLYSVALHIQFERD